MPYAERFIKKASKAKAELVVFPEVFLSRNCPIDASSSKSEKICLAKLLLLAKKYKIGIIAGSIIEFSNGKKHNTSYYINSSGKIAGKYQKEHLWVSEKSKIKKGSHIAMFSISHIKIGLIICWDLMFPDIFQKLKRKGVETIICPSNWNYQDARTGLKYDSNSEVKLVNSLCVERAFENEIILVFCNTAGKSLAKSQDVSVGISQIAEPFRGVIKKLPHNREAMFVCEIDTSILKDAEKAYHLKRDILHKK